MQISLGQVVYPVVTIASGETESSPITTSGMSLCGLFLPAAFTGVKVTFEAALTVGGAYQPVVDKTGAPISYTVAQGDYVAVDPSDFYGIQFLKIVSGTAEAAARSITCSMKGL